MNTDEVDIWTMIHAERLRVDHMLEGLSQAEWQSTSLCTRWSAEQVVAHLTAGAHTGGGAWLWSVVCAGFNASKHNDRRLARFAGGTPDETLALFREPIPSTIAPSKDFAAWLGEVVVHGQDIAQPLGWFKVPCSIS